MCTDLAPDGLHRIYLDSPLDLVRFELDRCSIYHARACMDDSPRRSID